MSYSRLNNLESGQKAVQEFCEARDWDQFHDPKELATGLVTEASELLDLFRFKSLTQIADLFNDTKKREGIEDELADVFFFVLRFAQRNRVDLLRALERKMEKNDQKYPVEKARGSNRKYNE